MCAGPCGTGLCEILNSKRFKQIKRRVVRCVYHYGIFIWKHAKKYE